MNKAFHNTNRLTASTIRYPRVAQTGQQTLLVKPKRNTTDVTSLQRIPSKSTCEEMLKTLRLGAFKAVSCNLGTFDVASLEAICNIHDLCGVAADVQMEKAWLAKTVVPPNEKCTLSTSDMASFKNLIWSNPKDNAVFDYDHPLLASDLALLSGTKWLNYAVLSSVANVLQVQGGDTASLMLNELLEMDDKGIREVIHKSGKSTKYITFFVNVGRSREVFFGTHKKHGNHWTLLYIDLEQNKWYYCDPYGWGTPTNIKTAILPIVSLFYEETNLKPRPFKGCMQGPFPKGSQRLFPHLKNLPIQTCGSVCGVIAAILGGIASVAPSLWRHVFLSTTAEMPEDLKWLLSPSIYSDFLRCSLVSWLLNGKVDLKAIGIHHTPRTATEHIPEAFLSNDPQRDSPSKRRRMRAKLRRRQRKQQTPISRAERLDVYGCREPSNQNRPKQVKLDDPDYIYVEDDCASPKRVDDHPKSSRCFRGDLKATMADKDYCVGSKPVSDGPAAATDDKDDLERAQCVDDGPPAATDSEDDFEKAQCVDDDPAAARVSEDDFEKTHCVDDDPPAATEDKDDLQKPQCVSDVPATATDDNDGLERAQCVDDDPPAATDSEDDFEKAKCVDDGTPAATDTEDDLEKTQRVDDDPPDAKDFEDDLEKAKCVDDGPPVAKDDENDLEKPQRVDDGPGTATGDEDNHSAGKGSVASRGDKNEDDMDTSPGNCATEENKSKLFYIGQLISSIDELESLIKDYEDRIFCELWKKDVRTLKAAAKRVPRKVELADPALKYYSLLLSCKFGGEPRKRTDRIRKTKTFRQGCPFEIYIRLAADGQSLEVNRIKELHNHELAKELYERLPRQRAVSEEDKIEMENAIKLKANSKLLRQKIEQSTGKKVTLKDIANMKQKTRQDFNRNDLDSVINYLRQQKGSTAEVIINQENNFEGLFFQDEYMRQMYSKFPELLLVDATYKLLELRMPVYLLLCVDGEGLSEIVGMFILAEETKAVIEAAVGVFKKFNPSWSETKVVMSDKDFSEREAFTKCFPGASLNICLYHTLRSFRREITCEKMGISSDERYRCLEILTELAYSRSSKEFEKHLQALENTSSSVKEYIEINWVPIKEQWVTCFKDNTMNLDERTNNRLESTFGKFKSVCSKYASLLQFFHEFFAVLASLLNERNHHFLMTFTRRPIDYVTFDGILKNYADFLTPYSFEFVREQFNKASSLSNMSQTGTDTFAVASSKDDDPIITTAETCTCSFAKRMGLPCRHIFKARTILQLPLFESSLVKKRWTRDFYKAMKDSRFTPESVEVEDVQVTFTDDCSTSQTFVSVQQESEGRILSQAQKFRKGLQTAQIVASLMSEGGMATFRKRYELLQDLISHWKMGTEVALSPFKKSYGVEEEIPVPVLTDEQVDSEIAEKVDAKKSGRLHGLSEQIEDVDSEISVKPEISEQVGLGIPLDGKSELKEDSSKTQKKEHGNSEYGFIRMPPKMVKRGRPKGAELTVIGLPKSKRRKEESNKLLPFSKLHPNDKSRIILECLSSQLAAAEALSGKRLLNEEDVKCNIHLITDTIRDTQNVDVHRVQKYFTSKGWLAVLSVLKEKENSEWFCPICDKVISSTQNSIACDRCLLWCHFSCTTLTKMPKCRNWFCKGCKVKYQ